MEINLGDAVAGAATAISVLDEYFQELHRIERIPPSISTLCSGRRRVHPAPRCAALRDGQAGKRRSLHATAADREFRGHFGGGPPEVFPLDIKALLKIVALPEATVGL